MGRLTDDGAMATLRSPAFAEALVRSEIRRGYAVIGVVLLIVAPVALLASLWPVSGPMRLVGVSAALAVLGLQVAAILIARQALRRKRPMPTGFVVLTVVVECLVPTKAMWMYIDGEILPPYTVLSAPPVAAYGLLIGLTTLRLRPWLCLLAGVIGSAGYLGLFAYVEAGSGWRPPATALPEMSYLMFAVLVFATGAAAAWVAGELRLHVAATLREAEAKRRMDRIEQDLLMARTFQQAMLPRGTPEIPGFDVAGWNRPADQTGGDYYDWQALPGGHWIISLADVCGHGVGPALATAACRAYVRASSTHHPDLGSLATAVNRLLAQDLPEGRFVTLAAVLLDPSGRTAAVLSAGHGPIALYVGSTGEVRDILPHGMPLAVEPDVRFGPAQMVPMGPGDVLALITDGFSEWSRTAPGESREDFGIGRLRESLRRHAHRPASDLINGIVADASAFAGTEPQQDDLTIVVIRRVA